MACVRPKKKGCLVAALALSPLLLACETAEGLSRTEKGAVLGGVLGGAAGGIISNSVRGTLIGAVLGGVAGAIIGKVMDRRADQLAASLDAATVQRVGEGIAVTFAPGSVFAGETAEISAEGREELAAVAKNLLEEEGTEAVVVGHAPETGEDELALRRARAVEEFLVEQGVARERIRVDAIAVPEAAQGEQALESPLEIAIVASEEARERARQEAALQAG